MFNFFLITLDLIYLMSIIIIIMLKEPSSEQFSAGEKGWIKDIQKSMSKDTGAGKFRRLNPYLNEVGIYMVSGKMEYWFEYTYNAKGLVLLPSKLKFFQVLCIIYS